MNNVLYIASAGAGKTTYIVKSALKLKVPVLITTFTIENEQEIRKIILEINKGIIPDNIKIQTWFSFLLKHAVKPYQSQLTDKNINGLVLVNKQSSQYINKQNIDSYYFSLDYKIFSDKISSFAIECNSKSKGLMINRVSDIFDYIFIDEVQDLAGYDLELVKKLLFSKSKIIMAGDPRQVTYHTHFSKKYKKYKNGRIDDFINKECNCKSVICEVDFKTLNDSYRNCNSICAFANQLYPDYPKTNSISKDSSHHDGIFYVRKKDVEKYLEEHNALQLRLNAKTKVNHNFQVMSYGASKGKTVERVIIYPTNDIKKWLINSSTKLKDSTKSKFYVAVTRAKFSVAFVVDDDDDDFDTV